MNSSDIQQYMSVLNTTVYLKMVKIVNLILFILP